MSLVEMTDTELDALFAHEPPETNHIKVGGIYLCRCFVCGHWMRDLLFGANPCETCRADPEKVHAAVNRIFDTILPPNAARY